MRENRITVWFSVPSVIHLALAKDLLPPGSLPSLRWSLFCGEALTRDAALLWQAAAPYSVVENLYGPTELTIACSAYRWHEGSPGNCLDGVVPIGAMYRGLEPLIVDAELEPVAEGETGELCVAGPQVFPGYWREPEKTSRVKLMHRSEADGVERCYYRTGDRVSATRDGRLHYRGRLDHQIKVGGHRVELGEVEAALRAQAGVSEAVAFGWPVEGPRHDGVVAFVCGREIDLEEVNRRVRALLPAYMAPRELLRLDRMPRNANGKVDRGALKRRLREA